MIPETFQKIVLSAFAGLYAKCKLALQIGFIDDWAIECDLLCAFCYPSSRDR